MLGQQMNTNGRRGTQSNSAPNAECIDSFHWIKLRGATEGGRGESRSEPRASCGRRRLSDNFPNAIMDREMDGRTRTHGRAKSENG